MKKSDISQADLKSDVHGNNAAITCPVCGKVFIVSAIIDRGKRACPRCEKSIGKITEKAPHQAWVERD